MHKLGCIFYFRTVEINLQIIIQLMLTFNPFSLFSNSSTKIAKLLLQHHFSTFIRDSKQSHLYLPPDVSTKCFTKDKIIGKRLTFLKLTSWLVALWDIWDMHNNVYCRYNVDECSLIFYWLGETWAGQVWRKRKVFLMVLNHEGRQFVLQFIKYFKCLHDQVVRRNWMKHKWS